MKIIKQKLNDHPEAIRCMECEKIQVKVIEFDLDEFGDDSCEFAWICEDCLKNAFKMLNGEEIVIAVITKKAWEIIRDKNMCEHFTDEELENAEKNNCKIKTGWVSGFPGKVEMWIDPTMPELSIKNNGPFSLKAGYKWKKSFL